MVFDKENEHKYTRRKRFGAEEYRQVTSGCVRSVIICIDIKSPQEREPKARECNSQVLREFSRRLLLAEFHDEYYPELRANQREDPFC